MRELFQQDLHEVQDRLVEIAELVVDAITDAVEAFNKSDVTLAESVIVRDNKIDDAVVALDELAIAIMARQAPVAKDLRIVVSALRIRAYSAPAAQPTSRRTRCRRHAAGSPPRR